MPETQGAPAAGAPAHGAPTAGATAPGGWGSVPHVGVISGTHEAPALGPAAPSVLPRPRRRLGRGPLIGIIAGGAAVVLLLVAGVVGYSVQTDSHSADRPVRAFLDDLSAGKVDDALRSAGIRHTKSDVLLTDAAYAKAKDRVTGYRITAVQPDGDTATVSAYLTQAGRQVPATFTLDKTGTDWGVFPIWKLQAPRLGAVDLTVQGPPNTTVTVAGQRERTDSSGGLTLSALPGAYAVAVDGGKWFSAPTETAAVRGFGSSAGSPVSLTTEMTDAGKQAATDAVNAWVDRCIASTSTKPEGCSFYAYGENPANTYTNQKWTLDSRPTVTVGEWLPKGWTITTSSFGSATYTADFTGPSGAGTATAGPINVNASGYITGFSDSGATFASAVGNGASDTGS
ncbi:hypothetical protein ACLBWP_11855 [Microbacterium sp. M1A1_1b]